MIFGKGVGGCLETDSNMIKFYTDRDSDVNWWARNHSPVPAEFVRTHIPDVIDKHNLGTIAQFI
jgi:hypothetical protein